MKIFIYETLRVLWLFIIFIDFFENFKKSMKTFTTHLNYFPKDSDARRFAVETLVADLRRLMLHGDVNGSCLAHLHSEDHNRIASENFQKKHENFHIFFSVLQQFLAVSALFGFQNNKKCFL